MVSMLFSMLVTIFNIYWKTNELTDNSGHEDLKTSKVELTCGSQQLVPDRCKTGNLSGWA